mmetsp:Transcript_3062/g.6914  ORF Transcript_3062/g.6914 Transcript_3062/m.6914 type:complete len:82 (+) Transcript_3062:450-695(+)
MRVSLSDDNRAKTSDADPDPVGHGMPNHPSADDVEYAGARSAGTAKPDDNDDDMMEAAGGGFSPPASTVERRSEEGITFAG